MNWGYKIVIGYSLFVAGIMFMVFRSMGTKTELINADYYQEELNYQKRIDEANRTQALSEPVRIQITANREVEIALPKDFQGATVTGNVTLYCPSDDQKDIQQTFRLEANDAHLIRIPLTAKNSGLHEVQLSWEANGKTYHHQEKLFL